MVREADLQTPIPRRASLTRSVKKKPLEKSLLKVIEEVAEMTSHEAHKDQWWRIKAKCLKNCSGSDTQLESQTRNIIEPGRSDAVWQQSERIANI